MNQRNPIVYHDHPLTQKNVDHVRDLYSTKEPIFLLSFMFLQTDLLSWSKNSGWCYSERTQCWSTISTSLIHNVASEEEPEQALTQVLNLIFQLGNAEGLENLSNGSSVICSLCCTAIEFCGISIGKKELMVDGFLANLGVGIVSRCRSSLLATGFRVLSRTGFPLVAFWFQEWSIPWQGVDDESITARGLPKNVSLRTKQNSMYQIADFGRGSASQKDLEQLPVDREREIIFPLQIGSTSWNSLESLILFNFPTTPVFVK